MIIRLFYACIIAGALAGFANSSAAQAAESQALVTGAVEKLGGAKRLAEIATLAVDGKHKHWDPQETPEPDVGNRLGGERASRCRWILRMAVPATTGFATALRR